jgi:hypothetical protein
MIDDDSIKKLMRAALEAGTYYGMSKEKHDLLVLLSKFGIKSARRAQYHNGEFLKVEGLDAVLKSGVTFHDSSIKLWKDLKDDSE